MAIKLVTDSASDILPREAERMGITIVPMTLLWDGVQYRDSFDMDHKAFFARLEESDTLPTTSQVTPDAFAEVFQNLTANGDTVLLITISSVLSGTYQSAMIAAEGYEGKVYVVDSLSATVGQRLLVLSALQMMKEDLPIETIYKALMESRSQVRILARLDTLEYLKRGGRISAAVAFAGGMLSIKPVITLEDGAIKLVGKARGSKNGNNLLRKLVGECGGVDFNRPYSLVYSGQSGNLLQQYIDDSADLWAQDTNTLPVSTIGAVIGTHVGPGAVGLAFFEKK